MKISAVVPLFLAALFCTLQLANSAGWPNPCTIVPFPFSSFCKIFPFPSTDNADAASTGSGSGSGGANATGNATRSLPILGKLPLGLPLR